MTDKQSKRPTHIIFQVIDPTKEGEKARWNRVGAGWTNKDGVGMNLNFFAYPVGGHIVARPNKEGPAEDGLPAED